MDSSAPTSSSWTRAQGHQFRTLYSPLHLLDVFFACSCIFLESAPTRLLGAGWRSEGPCVGAAVDSRLRLQNESCGHNVGGGVALRRKMPRAKANDEVSRHGNIGNIGNFRRRYGSCSLTVLPSCGQVSRDLIWCFPPRRSLIWNRPRLLSIGYVLLNHRIIPSASGPQNITRDDT